MAIRNTRLTPNLLSAALLTALIAPGFAMAQDAGSSQSSDSQEQTASSDTTLLDKVTVTGSRIKKVELEGPAPVTVITAADIEKQGFSTVYEALNTLSQNNTGLTQNELVAGSFTQGAQFLNLRGLGPGYQLVLINGRRTAEYPHPYNGQSNAVNIGSIPSGPARVL